jgi:hypothetical protein
MDELTPAFLLDNEDLVAPLAPWCVWLDNLELAILLLAQPWVGGGLRRAELEQQLGRIDLPVGPVYFQRVNRATAALSGRGQLEELGIGRQRRFATTTHGFAALLLNLQVLRADPTADGSEFELKRSLVALWNLVADRFLQSPEGSTLDFNLIDFIHELERIELWSRRVITDQTVADAFNVLRLIETQRRRVERLATACESRLQAAKLQGQLLGTPDSDHANSLRTSAGKLGTQEEMIAAVRIVAASAAPQLAAEASLYRYRAYLQYLDDLRALYATELKVVDLAAISSAATGHQS